MQCAHMRVKGQRLSQMSKIRTYSELSQLETFEERYRYLRLGGTTGQETFGFDRWINQRFYKSFEWQRVRNDVIIRDNGCDLGVPGYEIYSELLIHHMNPISSDTIKQGEDLLLDPEMLITTTLQTHNAIHYGNESLLPRGPITREAGDTTLW
jgi:hypothetical protein